MGTAAGCTPEVASCSPASGCNAGRCGSCGREQLSTFQDAASNRLSTMSYLSASDAASSSASLSAASSSDSIPSNNAIAVSILGRRKSDFSNRPSTIHATQQVQKKMVIDRLMEAVRQGNYKKTVAAVSEGADVHARTSRRQTPLMLAAGSSGVGAQETIQFLIDTMSDVEARDDMGWTALLHACRNDRRGVAKTLLGNGASIKARANDGKTVAMLATMDGGDSLVKELVSDKASLDRKDESGWSVLFFACEFGRTDLVKWLLKNKDGSRQDIDVREKSTEGMTAFMVAARGGQKKISELLLHKKASMNGRCKQGMTALMLSLQAQREEFADWLLEKGAVVAIDNEEGENAVQIAESMGMNALVNKLGMKYRQEIDGPDVPE